MGFFSFKFRFTISQVQQKIAIKYAYIKNKLVNIF